MQAVPIGYTLNCKGVNVLMINVSSEHGDVHVSGNTVSVTRNLGITCTCVFSFTPRPTYPRGNNRRYQLCVDTRWRSWLPHCASIRKVTGSILNGVLGILHRLNPSGLTMTGVDSGPDRNEYQDYLLGGKSGRSVRLTILPLPCAEYLRGLEL